MWSGNQKSNDLLGHSGSSALFAFFVLFSMGCSRVDFDKGSPQNAPTSDSEFTFITQGEPIDPDQLDDCDLQTNAPVDGVCLVFQDSFEDRSQIVRQGDFKWDLAIKDSGGTGVNVDATIHDSHFLGPIIDDNNAVLFRGRQGGSTHEIYMVSKPFDLRGYDEVALQFHYVPLSLEQNITLSWSGESVPEGISLEICQSGDYQCGLTGAHRHERLRDRVPWKKYSIGSSQFGTGLNIRQYTMNNWNLGKAIINVKDLKRPEAFVFKITVALDEGFINNNENNSMEDGLILDNVIMALAKNVAHD